jgi:hypothetical protein
VTWADSVKAVLWIVSIGTLLFLSAGTLDRPGAWIFMAEFVIGGLAVTLWLAWRDPGLLKERMSSPFQKDQVFWDKVFSRPAQRSSRLRRICRARTLQACPGRVVNLFCLWAQSGPTPSLL